MPRQTKSQHLAGLEWNIDDATQALINAVGMRNWKSAKKYIAQLEALELKKLRAEQPVDSPAAKRARATQHGPYHGRSAGRTFGRGKLP